MSNISEQTDVNNQQKPLKLDYGQTFKVGFAFAIIMVFWTAYDFVVPLLLENAYGLSNAMRGLIMGLDNLLSLFMLPLFGNLSDKAGGRWVRKFGRRTPFIVVGAILSAVLMVFVPISSYTQQVRADEVRTEYQSLLNDDTFMNERLVGFYDGTGEYCDKDYLKNDNITREQYISIRYDDKLKSSGGFLGIGTVTWSYDGETIDIEDAEYTSIKENNDLYKKFVASGMNNWISAQVNERVTKTQEGQTSLIMYMVILLAVLVVMATFRSPAVALMPDVTPKPLRSQGNAVINLCGGAGGAIAFLIYTVILMGKASLTDYVVIFGCIGASMLILLAGFLAFVREKKMVDKCHRTCEDYGIIDGEVLADGTIELQKFDSDGQPIYEEKKKIKFKDKSKEEKSKFISLLLILASVFMWFMGYNAVVSSLSIYTTKALNLSAGIASIISGVSMGVSAIAFIPVGFLAVKIGRRKSIMVGFVLAIVSFLLLLLFVNPNSNVLIPAVLFSLFYLIAGFGLIIINVNTFPMVVELAEAQDVGKYTGFYYTATMSAQAITPMLAGIVMDIKMKYLFLYAAIFVALAIVLMVFVKHGDSKQLPTHKLSKEEKKALMLDSMGDAD